MGEREKICRDLGHNLVKAFANIIDLSERKFGELTDKQIKQFEKRIRQLKKEVRDKAGCR